MAGNIMIIDDSPLDRKIIRQVLEKNLNDTHFFETENGLDIVDKLLLNTIDVCILDIMMPIKNGFQVLRELRAHPKLMDVPVIVCTGTDDRQAIEKSLSLGAYDYFAKPLSEEAMKISLPLKVQNAVKFMKRKEEIIHLSYYDNLTGLYNRRFWEEELKRLDNKRHLPLSLIVGDVNGLKLTNDAFGHSVGDKLLIKIADIIKASCHNDEVIARVGGDEFLIVLPKTDIKSAQTVIEKITSACNQEASDPINPVYPWEVLQKNLSLKIYTRFIKLRKTKCIKLNYQKAAELENLL